MQASAMMVADKMSLSPILVGSGSPDFAVVDGPCPKSQEDDHFRDRWSDSPGPGLPPMGLASPGKPSPVSGGNVYLISSVRLKSQG